MHLCQVFMWVLFSTTETWPLNAKMPSSYLISGAGGKKKPFAIEKGLWARPEEALLAYLAQWRNYPDSGCAKQWDKGKEGSTSLLLRCSFALWPGRLLVFSCTQLFDVTSSVREVHWSSRGVPRGCQRWIIQQGRHLGLDPHDEAGCATCRTSALWESGLRERICLFFYTSVTCCDPKLVVGFDANAG